MGHREQHVIAVSIEMALQTEFLTGDEISAARAPFYHQGLRGLGFHSEFDCPFVILEDFLQPLRLLAATGRNAVKAESISTGKIIDFQRVIGLAFQPVRNRSGLN